MRIFIFTCDAYAYVVPIWYHFWKKNWPTCPYDLVIVTGTKEVELPKDKKVSVVYQGEDLGYASNVIKYLSSIPDEYILLMQEDFIIHSVQPERVLQAEKLCDRLDVCCVRLITLPGPDLPFDEPDGEGFGEINKATADWVFSMQAAVWKKQVYIEMLKEGNSPWQTEHEGTPRARLRPERFLCSEDRVINYEQYCTLGEDIPSEVRWVRDNWGAPLRVPSPLTPETVTAHLMIRDEENWLGYILSTLTKFLPNVLVFDTGSTDSTIEIIKEFPSVKLVKKGELSPMGLMECRNEMMEMTETPWVWQVDGDEFYPEKSIRALLKCEMPVDKRVGFTYFYDVGWDGKDFRAYLPFHRVAILDREARYRDDVVKQGYPFETPSTFQDWSLFYHLPLDVMGYHLHHLERSSKDSEVYLRQDKRHKFSLQERGTPLGDVLKIQFGRKRWANPYF